MAKKTEDQLAPDEPREFEWAGVTMYRCPVDRCGWSHEDRDAVAEHIDDLGHLGADPVDDETEAEAPAKDAASKGGK